MMRILPREIGTGLLLGSLPSAPNPASNQFIDDLSMNVRQTAVNSIVTDRQPFVIDPQLMQNRGMNVIDLGGLGTVQGLVSPWVRFPVSHAAADTTATHPIGEHMRIVVASLASLGAGHPTKLSSP